ncbi:alpha/beta hydrolase [Variovorax sp. RCC_210]|uniref:alpha/beta hydrolase n=1 Tax=Variovorax sp. RCC_210 TaxID=3239217 RepID=UPI003523A0B0
MTTACAGACQPKVMVQRPEQVAGKSLAEVTAHFAELIARLPAPPVIVGHSFGGLIAQKLLGEGIGRAAVAIDPAQIKGVFRLPLAQLRAGLPGLGNPMNVGKAISLTKAQFRYGFGNAIEQAESDALFEKWCIPSPVRGLFEVAFANFTGNQASQVATANDGRGPLLMISGTADHTVPDVTTQAAFRMYRHSKSLTELRQFEGRGHSLTVDHGWRDVAQLCLNWLERQGMGAEAGVSRMVA